MPNSLGPTGLTTASQSELLELFTAGLQAIYGSDINLGPDTPDGQEINLSIQAILDVLDLITQVYNSFDPDKALGITLDTRVAYNGIQREAGTFTTTPITLVTNRSLTLPGLDQEEVQPYTVADNAGNQFQLIVSQTPGSAGTYVYEFQAVAPGAILTVPNTITVPVTVVLGVTSINNPTTYSVLGINEESDAALKIRRQKSVSLSSQGYLSGLLAALQNIVGVSSAFVYENITDTTDGDGIPGHSIWVIVAGGLPADIANAIYKKRNAGCGMFGATTYTITQVDGNPFIVKWDYVEPEDLYIQFTASSLDGINPPNIAAILAKLPVIFTPGVNKKVDINELGTLVQEIDPNTLVTNAGFSTTLGGSYTPSLAPSAKNKQFVVTADHTVITPMILSPSVVVVPSGGSTQQFTPLGGHPGFTYAVISGAGSVDGSGLYTSATAGTDVVQVTDSLGNLATATVTVS